MAQANDSPDTITNHSQSTGVISELLSVLTNGGPIGFAAICLVAVYLIAKAYDTARNQKDAVLMQWNSEARTLIVDGTEASVKIAEALNTLVPVVTKIDQRLFRLSERITRLEEKLHVKHNTDNDDATDH